MPPVPLPSPEDEDLRLPFAEEVELINRGVATAAAAPGGLTELQRILAEELSEALTGISCTLVGAAPLSADELALGLARRGGGFRTRIVQIMLILELILVPLPPEVTARVEEYAAAMNVDDETFRLARRLSKGCLGLAALDFERSGYFQGLAAEASQLHVARLADPWDEFERDDELAARWEALEHCPAGSLGRGVWQFYRARGFTFPGEPASAPPALAQHDWVHVLAGYGSTVESEIEIFGFISRASDDPEAFSLLAMVISLFETGYLRTSAAGFFAYDLGHLSRDARGMAIRLGDAMRRGALAGWHMEHRHPDGTAVDLLKVDWFEHANRPIDDVRREFAVVEKSAKALDAGSVTPWEAGGISPYQFEQGRLACEAAGGTYDSYGATPPPG